MTTDNSKILANKQDSKDKSIINSEELGGTGKDPTKYGDWQHKGKVTDF